MNSLVGRYCIAQTCLKETCDHVGVSEVFTFDVAGIWQVMLGVDRLDIIKGIPKKLLAFEKFLDENAEWRDKVLLVQIAVPTRTDVHDCMCLP